MSKIIEKYKPKSIDDLKLPTRIYNNIKENIDTVGYRFLFFGPPGTGKTSTALLMNSDKEKYDILYLSGSNDFNIDVLRNKVYPFCSNHSVLGKQKTLIIDEAENISDKIQDAFKVLLDNSKKVNFIFITNEINKMNTAILSRCSKEEYNYKGDELIEQRNNYILFLLNIIESEKLEHDKAGINELFKRNFPDIRQSLVLIQQLIDSKLPITGDNVKNVEETGIQNVDLYNILLSSNLDAQKFYESLTQFKGKEKECFQYLSEPFFRYLNQLGKFEQTLKSAEIVAKYSVMHLTTLSKFGNFFAMCSELRTIFR